jgi:predicted metal-binding protein
MEREKIESMVREHGFMDFQWISGKEVQVAQWVRFKCMFGCDEYGKKGACPPEMPPISDCRELFLEYKHILVLHFRVKLDHPDDRNAWSLRAHKELLPLERAAFLMGHYKAFLIIMDECRLCRHCPGTRFECKNPKMARPCIEGLGVDVYATVRAIGYPINVLTDYDQEMNRFAFLLIE